MQGFFIRAFVRSERNELSRLIPYAQTSTYRMPDGRHMSSVMRLGVLRSHENRVLSLLCRLADLAHENQRLRCIASQNQCHNTLACLTAKSERWVFGFPIILELATGRRKPPEQFLFRPVTRGNDQESRAVLDKRFDLVPVYFARMWRTSLTSWHERNSIEGALVQHNVKPLLEPIAWLISKQVPQLEA